MEQCPSYNACLEGQPSFQFPPLGCNFALLCSVKLIYCENSAKKKNKNFQLDCLDTYWSTSTFLHFLFIYVGTLLNERKIIDRSL